MARHPDQAGLHMRDGPEHRRPDVARRLDVAVPAGLDAGDAVHPAARPGHEPVDLGGLERALSPGGLVDQLLDEDGLIERVLAEVQDRNPLFRPSAPPKVATNAGG